jgi:hypothetical protein
MPESFLLGLALQEDRENWPPVTICEISRTHDTDLEYRTHGRDVSVWHEDRPRFCWYPTAFRKECTEAEGACVVYTTRWQGEDGQLMESPMPLRVRDLSGRKPPYEGTDVQGPTVATAAPIRNKKTIKLDSCSILEHIRMGSVDILASCKLHQVPGHATGVFDLDDIANRWVVPRPFTSFQIDLKQTQGHLLPSDLLRLSHLLS